MAITFHKKVCVCFFHLCIPLVKSAVWYTNIPKSREWTITQQRLSYWRNNHLQAQTKQDSSAAFFCPESILCDTVCVCVHTSDVYQAHAVNSTFKNQLMNMENPKINLKKPWYKESDAPLLIIDSSGLLKEDSVCERSSPDMFCSEYPPLGISHSLYLVVFQLYPEAVVGRKELTIPRLTLFQLRLQLHLIVPTHLLKLLQFCLGILCTVTHTCTILATCLITLDVISLDYLGLYGKKSIHQTHVWGKTIKPKWSVSDWFGQITNSGPFLIQS